MTFDIGEVLSRAGQITWRNKVLWLFSALPVAVNFLIFPAMVVPMFLLGFDSDGTPIIFENPILIVGFMLGNILISVLTFVAYTAGSSSLTLGIVRAEDGDGSLLFRDLAKDGVKYFVRILGIGLLVSVSSSLVFTVIMFGLVLFGFVTMGIGFICAQPLILLMYPLMMLLYALIEQSNAAVVADDLSVTDAIAQAWNLLKANFWRILLLSIIVYFAVSILSSVLVVPFMIPFFFFPILFTEPSQVESTFRLFGWIMLAFGVILLPVMALVQGVAITFMKSAYILTYLRLTRPAEQPAPVEAAI
ncbi:MAG: hypothetical protein IT313_03055 [Anaerolineales bacterium]|nr:hypothetical protein [Anaerolineales bacterium]